MLLFAGTLGRVLQPIVPSPVGDGAFPRQCGGWAAKPTCPQQWEQTTQPWRDPLSPCHGARAFSQQPTSLKKFWNPEVNSAETMGQSSPGGNLCPRLPGS